VLNENLTHITHRILTCKITELTHIRLVIKNTTLYNFVLPYTCRYCVYSQINTTNHKVILKGTDDGVLQLELVAFGPCPFSYIVQKKNTEFWEVDLLPPSGEGYLLSWVLWRGLINGPPCSTGRM
jgi:hypothetical protein